MFLGFSQIVTETLPALQELKKEGLVRAVGITGLPLDIYPYVLDKQVFRVATDVAMQLDSVTFSELVLCPDSAAPAAAGLAHN
jgi:hypothetical protein